MSPPANQNTHICSMCISAPGRDPGRESDGGLQALGRCKWTGRVCVCVCVCVLGRGRQGQYQCEKGGHSEDNYMPATHPRPAGIQALNLQEASHAAPSSVAVNLQLHSLASCDGTRPRKMAWGSCSLHRYPWPRPRTPAPDTHFFPPDAITQQRKLTLSLHGLCSPHSLCLLPLSLLFANFWSALDAVPVPMCYRLGNRDRCSELPTFSKKEVEARVVVLVVCRARWWGTGSEETERRQTPSRTACGNSWT